MRIIRCKRDNEIYYGVLEGDTVQLLQGSPYDGVTFTGETVDLAAVTLLSPCEPSKIVAVGINYAPHAKELNFDIPLEPLIFLKPSTSVIGPGQQIILPSMSTQVEYEAELAAVIGRKAKNVSREDALDYILGYTCCNDVTARDLQKKDVQFTRSKSFDTFSPLGPWIETDVDPENAQVRSFVNNELRQDGNTRDMVRSVRELIFFISQVMTLLPGDVLATGTPAGVGSLSSGDTVAVDIDQIGTLSNKVK